MNAEQHEWYWKGYNEAKKELNSATSMSPTPPKALQPEQEPVAWLQFRDNEPPVVAPRGLGTPVFLGIRGGLAHDAQLKEKNA